MATAASDTEESVFGFKLIFSLSLNVAWVHSVIPGHHSLFRVSESSEPGLLPTAAVGQCDFRMPGTSVS